MTNKDQIEGTWRQFKGKIQEKWGKLTDDDLDVIAGKKEQFLGALQKKEGLAREEAEKQLEEWQRQNPDYRFDD